MRLSLAIFMFLFVWPQRVAPQEEHHGHAHISMSMVEEMSPSMQAKLLADKKESEFNHHLAGLFVGLAGVFGLLQCVLAKRWLAATYAWPACFLVSGIFLLVWSDTELWPFRHREWLDALDTIRKCCSTRRLRCYCF